MPVPLLSIVVPTFDRRDSVICLLRALCSQTAAADTFEVVVVSDGSTDGTLEAVRNHAAPFSLRVLDQPRARLAAARNRGARESAGELVLFLDDDMEPEPGLVASHLASHRAAGVLGVVGPVPIVVPPDAAPVVRYRAATFADKMAALQSRRDRLAFNDVYGGNFSVRRHVFLGAGGYDEDFRAYGHEDYELALRIGRPAHRFVFDPAAVARQHYDKSLRGLAADAESAGRTAVLFARKHPDILTALAVGSFPRRSLSTRAKIAAAVTLSRMDDQSHERIVKSLERSERRIAGENEQRLFSRYDAAFSLLYWTGAERALHELGAPRYRLAIADVARWIREPAPIPTSG